MTGSCVSDEAADSFVGQVAKQQRTIGSPGISTWTPRRAKQSGEGALEKQEAEE